MIQEERITVLSGSPPRAGAYVLYWMQATHRVDADHALAYAILEGNRLALPVLAFFGLAPSYPGAVWRHYHFMLEGLEEAGESLDTLGIKLVIRSGDPVDGLLELSKDAALVVVDTGYLRLHREWVARVHGKHSAAPSSGLNRMPSSRS
jgi:deoxyribodipyrimidine photo-lyase